MSQIGYEEMRKMLRLQRYSDAIVKFLEDVFEVEKIRESTVICE